MENRKVSRLNVLFEKMVSNSANMVEKRELKQLYQEYINDGRDNKSDRQSQRRILKRVAMN